MDERQLLRFNSKDEEIVVRMSDPTVPASIDQQAFSCPNCGAYAHQDWFKVYAHGTRNGEPPTIVDDNFFENIKDCPSSATEEEKRNHEKLIPLLQREYSGEPFFHKEDSYCGINVINLYISNCYSCKRIAIWRHKSMIYPPKRYALEPNADLPEGVRADFDEARSILELSPRSSAAMLRLCIQKICKALKLPGRDLNSDIGQLVKQGLDSRVQKALDSVRVIGNEAVHPGNLDLKDDRATAERLFVLVNRIAYDLFTYPRELDAIYSDLPEDKIQGIQRRDEGNR